MSICPKCGKSVDGARFCPECGATMDAAQPQTDHVPVAAPVAPPADPAKPAKAAKEKKKMGKGKAIGIAVAVFLALGLFGTCSGGETENTVADSSTTDYQVEEEANDETATEPETEAAPEPEPTFVDTLEKMGSFEETAASGSGDDVVNVPAPGVPCLVELQYSGSGNFAVWSVDSNGNQIDLLVNEIGAYSGTVTTYMNYKDVSMLSVESDGSWSATFKPMSAMPKCENGSSFTGDGVVYIDEDSFSKVTFSNSGDSNFAVWGIGMSKSDLLVNEIGAYEGTVVWNQAECFFIVNSNGTWSVAW